MRVREGGQRAANTLLQFAARLLDDEPRPSASAPLYAEELMELLKRRILHEPPDSDQEHP